MGKIYCYKNDLHIQHIPTTSKVPIPEKARKEIELRFMHKVVKKVEKHSIPHSLILNVDQTPSKYVPSARYTLAQRNSKEVPDKRAVTATFVETLDSKFLPMQLIYGGKTKKSLQKIKFPDGFSLSANPSHFSNTEEELKKLWCHMLTKLELSSMILSNRHY